MKGRMAIAKTKERLENEFNQRKDLKLRGMKRHRQELQEKISKLEAELLTLNLKIEEVEDSSFRATQLSEESRRAQSQAAKRRKNQF